MSPALTELASGLAFPEGPTFLPDGSLVFVEIAAGHVARLTADGRKQVIARPGGSPNGAALGPDGALYICNSGGFAWERRNGLLWPIPDAPDYSGGRIERVDLATGKIEELYRTCGAHTLKGPNDLVFDRFGGFYFTDHGKRRARDVDSGGLYYAKADGSDIRELVFPLVTPNGVGLAPDGSEVYVAETDTGHVWAFAIESPGVLRKPSGPLKGRHLAGPRGFACYDSMAIEANGNLCVAALMIGGISVIAPDGEPVEFVAMADPLTTNICFGGKDMRNAVITLSGTGRLVGMRWPRPGCPLA